MRLRSLSLSTALAIGVAPVVRVRGIDDPDVSMLLDNGVTGIVYPDIANAAQARRAVEGVDVLHVGSNDLLVDMGKPGKFDDPDIIAAQDRVIAAAKKHGIFAGCGGNRDIERQVQAIRRGAQFVTTQTDIGFLSAAANAWTQGVRKALRPSGS